MVDYLCRTSWRLPHSLRETRAYLFFALATLVLLARSAFDAHVTWAHCAVIGYCIAALLSAAPTNHVILRSRLSRIAAVGGAVIVPFAILLDGHHQLQNEVQIIGRSGDLLISTGSPYVHHADVLADINPYLPVMSLFGVPSALLTRTGLDPDSAWNIVGDPRIWCALVAFAGIAVTLRLLKARSERSRHIAAIMIASPTIALEACASGVDLPLAGLLAVGIALAATRRVAIAAICIAAAIAIKWVAALSIPIIVAFLVTRYGRRAALRFALVLTAATTVFLLPAMFALSDVLAQVIKFPTGQGDVATPARSALPGLLLSSLGTGGAIVDAALLVICAIAITIMLIRRPPATFAATAMYLGVGFTAFFLLAPVGRFGYLMIPMVLFGLAVIARRAAGTSANPSDDAPLPPLAWLRAAGRILRRRSDAVRAAADTVGRTRQPT